MQEYTLLKILFNLYLVNNLQKSIFREMETSRVVTHRLEATTDH